MTLYLERNQIRIDFLATTTQARSQKNGVLKVLKENKTYKIKFPTHIKNTLQN